MQKEQANNCERGSTCLASHVWIDLEFWCNHVWSEDFSNLPKICQTSSHALRFEDTVFYYLKVVWRFLSEAPCSRPTTTVDDRHYLQSLTKHILQAGLASIKVHFSHAFEYRNEKILTCMYVHCNTFKAIELFRLRFEMSFLIHGFELQKWRQFNY